MEAMEWYKELMESAKYWPNYQERLAEVKRVEPAFLALRDSLSQEQRVVLETYLSACEEMDHVLLELAWDMSRERIHEEFYHLLHVEAFRRGLHREILEHGPHWQAAQKELEREERERTPEYLERCREFNRLALQIQEETGEVIPLIELDEN